MRKIFFLTALTAILSVPLFSTAGTLEDIWNAYVPKSEKPAPPTPGRLIGVSAGERMSAFVENWKYRSTTYELHYDDPAALARTVYDIALHTGDIDKSLAHDRFVKGVLGYHYRTEQICRWFNDVVGAKFPAPTLDEFVLAGLLLQDGIITFNSGRFVPTGKATHVLAAASGKNRPFAANLRHERLHIFWDEDKAFHEKGLQDWQALSPDERAAAKKQLSRYAGDNEKQLIEEWAVSRTEASNIELK